jgi:hypothetical protein
MASTQPSQSFEYWARSEKTIPCSIPKALWEVFTMSRKSLANMRLTGTLLEVSLTLKFFRELGLEWNSIKAFEALPEESNSVPGEGQFDYFIQDVTMPSDDLVDVAEAK